MHGKSKGNPCTNTLTQYTHDVVLTLKRRPPKGRFPLGVFLLADEKNKRKRTRGGKKKKLNNVQLSFESESVKICKNQLTNQIEEKAECFSTREQKNSQWKWALTSETTLCAYGVYHISVPYERIQDT